MVGTGFYFIRRLASTVSFILQLSFHFYKCGSVHKKSITWVETAMRTQVWAV